VELPLVLTREDQRNRIVKLVMGATIERLQLLSGQREVDKQHIADLGAWRVDAGAKDALDPRIGENSGVKCRSCFGLGCKPKAGGKFLLRRHLMSSYLSPFVVALHTACRTSSFNFSLHEVDRR